MHLLQASQAPVIVTLPGGKKIDAPKLTFREVIAWGNDIATKRMDEETEGMDEDTARQYRRFYPKMPPTIGELRGHTHTPDGVEFIMRQSLGNAGIPKDQIDEIFVLVGLRQLEPLAVELADLEDVTPKRNPNAKRAKDNESSDPTTTPAKSGSTT